MNSLSTKATLDLLLQKYHSLNSVEREVLRIMASIGGNFSSTSLKNIVDDCEVRYIEHRLIQPKEWRSIIDTFSNDGLIVNSYSQHFFLTHLLTDTLSREAVTEGKFKKYLNIASKRSWSISSAYINSYEEGVTKLRRALYSKDFHQFHEIVEHINSKYTQENFYEHFALKIFNNPFDPDLLNDIRPDIKEDIIRRICALTHFDFARNPELISNIDSNGYDLDENLRNYLLSIDKIFFGEQNVSYASISDDRTRACLHALNGEFQSAASFFSAVLKSERKRIGKRIWFFEDISGALYLISLLAINDIDTIANLFATVAKKSVPNKFIINVIYILAFRHTSNNNISQITSYSNAIPNSFPLYIFVYSLALNWIDKKYSQEIIKLLKIVQNVAHQNGTFLMVDQCTQLLDMLNTSTLRPFLSYQPICNAIRIKEQWEHIIDALENVGAKDTKKKSKEDRRIIWRIIKKDDNFFVPIAIEQKCTNDRWSKGRELSNYGYFLKNNHSTISPKDLPVLKILSQEIYKHGYNERTAALALSTLIGHPLVFWEDQPDQSVDVIAATPAIVVKKNNDKIHLTMSPLPVFTDLSCPIVKLEGPNRLAVIKFNPEQKQIARLLGNELQIPLSAQETLGDKLHALTRVIPVHSEVEHIEGTVESILADNKLHCQLFI